MGNLFTNGDGAPGLVDLATDWYIPSKDLTKGFAYPGPVNFHENDDMYNVAQEMLDECKKKTATGKIEFSLTNNGRRFRVHKIPSIEGDVFAVRRIPSIVPEMKELGLPPAIVKILLHDELKKGGLILISGETGQGKSTTTGATIKARLDKFTSFCLTIEDPVELPLHGDHKNGKCIQTEIDSGGFAEALKGAVRSYPALGNCILYVGESRDPETAYEALVASSNGHLVFTTLHAYDVESSINRFISLASSYKNTTEDTVRGLFASSFRLILNQELRPSSQRKQGYRLKTRSLFSASGKGSIAENIKNNRIASLSTDIEQQKTLIQNENIKALFDTWK